MYRKMLRNILIAWLTALTQIHSDPILNIVDLGNNPIVLIKQINCKIQTGTINIIHPINLDQIEESAELVTAKFYAQLTSTNPLHEVIKFRIKKLYSSLYALKPQKAHRQKRWDTIGTAWKWIAGSPDAQDLRIINSSMNDLINQNNQQYKINENINNRITQLTQAINQIASSINNSTKELDILQAVTTMLNVDIVNELLDNIQEAIALTRISVINNKILTTREINVIKSALQDQGVEINFPDEALQFVTPKIAVNNGDLLYILHVPELENSTSTITRIFPLIVNDQIIKTYPSHVIRHGPKLFKTSKPEDFVQRSSYIDEIEDDCIKPIILGKESRCISIFKNDTIQQLINENTILISNARNQTLKSNCGPDDRTITGNFIIKFANCTVKFNGHKFQNSEIIGETEVLYGALYNTLIHWTLQKEHDITEIRDTAIINRQKLDHIHLRQNSLRFSLWTTFGGISLSTVICFIAVILCIKNINICPVLKLGRSKSNIDPRRLELKEGEVNIPLETTLNRQLDRLQQHQRQLAETIISLEPEHQQTARSSSHQ
ncbi:uncharacterized protein LOC129779077 [Toxorhynchites rutilus septentrionalis]|uniref:uncharacterized protein LOC129770329 n=1 Tax=Toxorhynchites rutilus septentrionalis TaxID=329112 RepID=UPI0024793412|nr:uncharacterized protein LOC129770329 [Toxorhynchites rutilus septentrionalis]XP_055629044.1 uncharacterized protein LOC129770329 [Toxorhynchites rutilus septentrionalis]XP_055635472.1 uncharacterized protein LOC129775146 [Toxorhynchites rutilus septentrionalis]XP_055635473.1 uncharacterized protein LOC129775146 [Toxorhynchites rutilus septentrionalis]XP_055642305.1 uncharacterized protein LOC129779077 [Toxorhynchites rutilus septentrionalis]XP_055642306.1 uncharacterized protein LOC12977907